jgi:predicted component of type VI protein secretion system
MTNTISAQGTGLAELQLALEQERKALADEKERQDIVAEDEQSAIEEELASVKREHRDRTAFLDARIAAIDEMIGGAA